MRIMGVDPGLIRTGYGVIQVARGDASREVEAEAILLEGPRPELVEGGVVRGGSSRRPLEARLLAIYNGLTEVLAEFQPQAMALEELYVHRMFPATAIWMAHARGAAALAAAKEGVPVFSYTSAQVKEVLLGRGRGSKGEVQRMVQVRLGLAEPPKPYDVADALALALCHFYTASLKP